MECDITFEKPVLKDMEEIARLLYSPAHRRSFQFDKITAIHQSVPDSISQSCRCR